MGSIRRPKKKKNRSKVVQKSKKNFKKLDLTKMEPKIRKLWDIKATPEENYKRLGLAMTFDLERKNDLAESIKQRTVEDEESEEDEEEDSTDKSVVPEKTIFEELFPPQAPEPKKEPKLSEGEQVYYKKLIAKHGTNYEAMFRDMKLNFYQHVPTKLKSKCELYLTKYAKGKPKGNAWKNHPLPQPESKKKKALPLI